jgi:GT2 family glycosyltransferase
MLPRLFGWADVYDVPEEQLRIKRDCDWLGGAFLFIRASALRRTGPLDAGFFFYGEDIEFCHRFHRHGYRVHYDPAAAIVHIGGSSSDPTRVPAKQRNIYMWQARYLVQKKCYGAAAAWIVRGADILAFGLRKTKMFLTGKRRTASYRDVSDALVLLLKPLRP